MAAPSGSNTIGTAGPPLARSRQASAGTRAGPGSTQCSPRLGAWRGGCLSRLALRGEMPARGPSHGDGTGTGTGPYEGHSDRRASALGRSQDGAREACFEAKATTDRLAGMGGRRNVVGDDGRRVGGSCADSEWTVAPSCTTRNYSRRGGNLRHQPGDLLCLRQ